MAAYAILSGFKDRDDLHGVEIERGAPLDMKAKAKEIASSGSSPFIRVEVVHSRRGRIGRYSPDKIAAHNERRDQRARDRAKRDAEATARMRREQVEALKARIDAIEGKGQATESAQTTGATPKPTKAKSGRKRGQG